MDRCELKTARLFEASCELGALAARADASTVAALGAFGRRIGLAFQLLDDVLDVSGPAERTGKARGTDLLDGTVTLPLIAAVAADPSIGETDLRTLDAPAAERLCDRIAATGALGRVRARALELVASAKAQLDGDAFDAEQRQLLGLVADGVVQRYS
jgi:geranylgeranyl pyrophosphate synthase